MVYFKNKSNWFWIGLALTVLNLSLLGTLGYNYRKLTKDPIPPKVEERVLRFMSRELGFSQEQKQELRSFRRKYMESTFKIRHELKFIQENIFEEVSDSEPNLDKLKKLSEKHGTYETELKTLTWQHFLDVRSICTDQQKERLSVIFQNLDKPNKYFKHKRKYRNRDKMRKDRGEMRERGNRRHRDSN